MNILITGGAGFIGTALAEKLYAEGFDITLLDLPNKFGAQHSTFKKYSIDIRNKEQLLGLAQQEKYEVIYHLAAQTSSVISQEQPELDLDTNIKGTFNVCEFARICGAKKIIFSSSMATYGNKQGKITTSESQNPVSNYGVSKISGEKFIQLNQQYGINNTIFRLFNVYGPGQDMSNLKQGMVSIFMAMSIKSDAITVTGSLERYRDFIYIDDVVNALVLGLDGKTDSLVFNVGSEVKTTVKELIDIILEINEKPSESIAVENIGSHEGDQFGSVSDTSVLKSYGWKPEISLRRGLEKMYAYAKEVVE